jgi:acetyl esterase
MASRWLTRFALRRLMRLPPAVLRLLSGGGTIYQGGRTLDPGFQFLAARTRSAPPFASMTPEEARRALTQAIALSAGDPARGVKTVALDGGPVPLRAYRPERQDPSVPALVFAHGGGGVLGDLDSIDAFCSQLAAATRGPVVSADYRLGPEDRFPAGLEDFAAAFAFVRDNAACLGAPAGRAAIGGDSLGATLAAAVCQQLKRDGAAQPELQLLLYPLLDATVEDDSMVTYADAFGLSRASMDWCLGHYLDPADDPADLRVSPGRARDLSGLAPAVIVAAGFDPLVDQGLVYARRLREAGVEVDYRVHDSLVHGFTAYAGIIPAAQAACDEAAALVRRRLSSPRL